MAWSKQAAPANEPFSHSEPTPDDLAYVDQLVAQYGADPEAAIPLLQALHNQYRYLPQWALERICQQTGISPAQIWGVATFYSQFRLSPVGKHLVQVCHGTACHAGGAWLVQQAFEHYLGIPPGSDTDPARLFTIEKIACLGCCSLAPVVRIDDVIYGHLSPARVPQILRDFLRHRRSQAGLDDDLPRHQPADSQAELRVGLDSCCRAQGHDRLYQSLVAAARKLRLPVTIKRVGCSGLCHQAPAVEVAVDKKRLFYLGVTPSAAERLVQHRFPPRPWWRRISTRAQNLIRWLWEEDHLPQAYPAQSPRLAPFLGSQLRIATEHAGELDPLDLDEYIRSGGLSALRRAIFQMTPQEIINEITASGLRGRGGAGFPTGKKWAIVAAQSAQPKFVICNGDEGDPGAFMDRTILESFPFRVIEGMAIAAVATGCRQGFFYIRAEYPLAVRRIRRALEICRQAGIIGPSILGSQYELQISVREGAGAFVCGEETALIASLEGKRGMPRFRPPFPAESGYHDLPTLINNVETFACVPWIIRHGAKAFASVGTATSKGTKVFALAGKIRRGGLIEVPMGMTLRQIVEDIGGGVPQGRTLKAVQVGGPSGGCLPAHLLDLPVDYEALTHAGAIMGSGGMVVFDDTDCMVDVARYFLSFTQSQSCGKCTFCRLGTRRMLEILEAICLGQGQPRDLEELETLAQSISQASLCGLGKTAPNPVLSTLRYFREEYEEHLAGRCPARRCKALIRYVITERCLGCTLCAQHCPARCIPLTPYRRHRIDQSACTRCDTCREICPVGAVEIQTGPPETAATPAAAGNATGPT
ncbi:MAG: NAD(P)H-dependent oxidoreductase subunit E [Thermoguttaceae bacterium]|nr:NAD(P)H-dependent oxidoreductase subunit E [Thermoguttaceae bacterium]